ncbi:UbiD family decarboxylase [Pseudochrobactrum asaccharolyticum]|uniref:2,5-furandicarboxylate decarboxylase 1 n=1 Tax=Pseudochrobactrum asaccharolyticum TaxID=354351 RepID=A0A366DK01_9HYPH|nr:UbiD family decarboxylase [Pseudochrobactrum asaccharolyticum]MBX8803160.1 UbiD family decarboxylase [Ochrobactrum sp. MR28]MBX8818740.1 UbiD family decarboxylase [Ochrobactrum sp. MR31]RBO90403.1 2,5-furandicarboxylate decarboxylase 1 [Pseudochrobactrum asaccharolyticum]
MTDSSMARRAPELRDWLKTLHDSDRLCIIQPGTELKHTIAGIANRMDGTKATAFPDAGGTGITVISGLLSDRSWMAEALGVKSSELVKAFQRAAASPLPWHQVDNAACQQIIVEDGDLLGRLPIPVHNEFDSGSYITAGLLIARNPRTGIQNVAIHRLQVSGPRELGVLLLPRHTLAFFNEAESTGADLDVAIVVGCSPSCLMASQAILPIDHDELEVAGALNGTPLAVTKCIGSEIRVPADAEIVIEGRLLAQKRAPEGPFGEFPQYYGERAERHVIAVDRITHRENPLFHTIVGGALEHLLLGALPREATILSTIQASFSNVKAVHLTLGGVGRYHLVVQLQKRNRGEAKNIIAAAFAAHYDIKHVVVVDEDVDIYDERSVAWAIATRFQADRDVIIIGGAQGSKLDPSTDDGFGSKMGLDATVPFGAPEFKFTKIRVPGEMEIDLDTVIAPHAELSAIL